MNYFLGIPAPPEHARRIEAFRQEVADWARRAQRSEPHISIKGGSGLDESAGTLATIEEISTCTAPFPIQVGPPALFEGENVLYLSVDSPGWVRLNRELIDTIAARTGAEMHPLERAGWIPHLTIIRLRPELLSRFDEIVRTTVDALSPFPRFTARTLRMYRQERSEGVWSRLRDFTLSGDARIDELGTGIDAE